jgi:diguanylate cyclase (GGDEF)-like protein
MIIDLPTLMIAGSFIAATSGVFLIFAWSQNRESRAMLWWAAANLVLAAGVPLMAGGDRAVGTAEQILAVTLLNLSPALIWASARSANGQQAGRGVIAGGVVLWLVALAIPGFRASYEAQTFLNLSVVAAYLFAAAAEFWKGRSERLGSRWPLIVLLSTHAMVFAVGAVQALAGNLPASGSILTSSWFGFLLFEALVFVLGTAIFIVAIDRERTGLRQTILASVDELTGVASRRAFFVASELLLADCQADRLPFSLLVFDLDRFKEVNDTHGHMAGDQVLEVFGDCVRDMIRVGDVVGRPGGEEFAVAMPGAGAATAYVAAERIRIAFAERCRRLGTLRLSPTVSAGVTTARSGANLDTLFADADRALYRAKQLGRDRVEMDLDRGPGEPLFGDLPAEARVA